MSAACATRERAQAATLAAARCRLARRPSWPCVLAALVHSQAPFQPSLEPTCASDEPVELPAPAAQKWHGLACAGAGGGGGSRGGGRPRLDHRGDDCGRMGGAADAWSRRLWPRGAGTERQRRAGCAKAAAARATGAHLCCPTVTRLLRPCPAAQRSGIARAVAACWGAGYWVQAAAGCAVQQRLMLGLPTCLDNWICDTRSYIQPRGVVDTHAPTKRI